MRPLLSGLTAVLMLCLVTEARAQERKTLTGHVDAVLSLAFSYNGLTIASGGMDSEIKLWDAASGVLIKTFGHSYGGIYSVAFSPDGKTIVSGSGDETIKLWDVASGAEIQTITKHSSYV